MPKILSAALILLFIGAWIINVIVGFTENVFTMINNLS